MGPFCCMSAVNSAPRQPPAGGVNVTWLPRPPLVREGLRVIVLDFQRAMVALGFMRISSGLRFLYRSASRYASQAPLQKKQPSPKTSLGFRELVEVVSHHCTQRFPALLH